MPLDFESLARCTCGQGEAQAPSLFYSLCLVSFLRRFHSVKGQRSHFVLLYLYRSAFLASISNLAPGAL